MKQLLKIKLLFFILLLSNFTLKGQELYLNSGVNLTKYNFNSSDNSPLVFNINTNQFYELGYSALLMNEKLIYSLGTAINNYDCSAVESGNQYEWKTTFIGINNHLEYAVISSQSGFFKINAGAQMQLMHIISGEQKLNGEQFDLSKEKEFKGFWLQPGLSITANYAVNELCQLSLGYNYSEGFNLSNNSEEKLKLFNQQIRFGVHYYIN